MACGIYKIENKLNGKVYIGQSINIESRWKSHIRANDSSKFHIALKEVGVENFDFSILEECPKEKLNEREIYWIKYYDSANIGYNSQLGGNGGCLPTPSTIYEIYSLLRNTELTDKQIGEQFGLSRQTVCGINTGKSWRDSDLDYPIRKPKQYFCSCGKEITSSQKYCSDCYKKLNTKVLDRPSKEELFDLLVSLKGNFTELSRRFGVSDNAIRKWCKTYGIPSASKAYKDIKQTQKACPAEKVAQIDKETGKIIKVFSSLAEAERSTGIYHIREASNPNSNRKSAGGFLWKRL